MKRPALRLLNEQEVVVLHQGWNEGYRWKSAEEYCRACGPQYVGKKIFYSDREFRQAKNAKLSPVQRAQKRIDVALARSIV